MSDEKRSLSDDIVTVVRATVRMGGSGLTATSIAATLLRDAKEIRPRITKLVQQRRLFDSGERVPSRRGRAATVYTTTAPKPPLDPALLLHVKIDHDAPVGDTVLTDPPGIRYRDAADQGAR